MPKVSVFMPCYNAGEYLREAIESILNQTYKDFELIIVNDGSTDGSLDIIKEYCESDSRVTLIDNGTNKGVAYTRTLSLSVCNGEYVALMDSDDVAPVDRLQIEVDYLDRNSEINVVSGDYVIINEDGTKGTEVRIGHLDADEVRAKMLFTNVIANSSSMYRKSALENFKFVYKDNYCGLEDYDFWCHFPGNKVVLAEILLNYRMVSSGLSKQSTAKKLELRNKRFDEIHEYYLSVLGINLSDKDKLILFDLTRETYSKTNFFWKIKKKIFVKKMIKKVYNHKDAKCLIAGLKEL